MVAVFLYLFLSLFFILSLSCLPVLLLYAAVFQQDGFSL